MAISTKLGTKFFLTDSSNPNNYPLLMRLRKAEKELDKYTFIVEDGSKSNKTYVKFTEKQIMDNYAALKPDGFITYSIAQMTNDGYKDVIVALFKYDEAMDAAAPFAVCRQGISDYFTNLSKDKKHQHITYIGMSISQYTCPAELDMRTTLMCDAVIASYVYSIYMDDTLDTILSLITNMKKLNSILLDIKARAYKDFPDYRGYCSSMEELFKSTRFMYDFYSCFNIIEVPIVIDKDQEFLNKEQQAIFEHYICTNVIQASVMKYKRDFRLDDIKCKYSFIRCGTDDIYIAGYDEDLSRPYYTTAVN